MSALPTRGSRVCCYARFSTVDAQPEAAEAPRRNVFEFDLAHGTIVQRVYSNYTGGLSRRAIAQALQDADLGGLS